MSCLASKKIVHGDLACRNILVFNFHHTDSHQILVKLTDFGLTRASSIYQATNYPTSTINIVPFRSCAPEILQSLNDQRLYTEKSDIFSMGVLMWECLSKGVIPWIDLTEEEVKRKVVNGERLKRPQNSLCSDQLWSIILRCMAQRPEDRPTFIQLDRLISNLFSSRAPLYKRYAQYISLQYQVSANYHKIINRYLM
jgi:serine/threonine protein kinase